MIESELSLEEAIQYMKEASEHEKNKQFRKFVEGAILILQHFAETGADLGLDLLIDILLDTTDEYLQTKNLQLLSEALHFLNLDED
ncbi:MAG: hypothetical protein GU362_06185 [Thaumarchaeota archaeon]|jgi:hypothetical protein|nr:hypothetical protein [Nitrososphaerota archaeon]